MKGEVLKSSCKKRLFEVGCSGGERRGEEVGVEGVCVVDFVGWRLSHRELSVEEATTLCE